MQGQEFLPWIEDKKRGWLSVSRLSSQPRLTEITESARGLSDPVADDQVIDYEANPARGEDGYGENDLPEKIQFVVLENVQHAPYCGNDTEDVNNTS